MCVVHKRVVCIWYAYVVYVPHMCGRVVWSVCVLCMYDVEYVCALYNVYTLYGCMNVVLLCVVCDICIMYVCLN